MRFMHFQRCSRFLSREVIARICIIYLNNGHPCNRCVTHLETTLNNWKCIYVNYMCLRMAGYSLPFIIAFLISPVIFPLPNKIWIQLGNTRASLTRRWRKTKSFICSGTIHYHSCIAIIFFMLNILIVPESMSRRNRSSLSGLCSSRFKRARLFSQRMKFSQETYISTRISRFGLSKHLSKLSIRSKLIWVIGSVHRASAERVSLDDFVEV